MTYSLSAWVQISLLVLASGGYSLATVGMKLTSGAVSFTATALIAVGLLAAAVAEIILMRQVDLPVIYIGIIAVETLLVLSYAAMIGEVLTLVQLSGGILVFVGFVLVAFSG